MIAKCRTTKGESLDCFQSCVNKSLASLAGTSVWKYLGEKRHSFAGV